MSALPRPRYRPRIAVEVTADLALVAAFALGFSLVATSDGIAGRLAGSPLLVVVTIHAILLFHDCMHQSAFGNRRLETWIARLIGAYFGCPFHFLRAEHLRHHRKAGLVDDDPEALHLAADDAARRPFGRLLARVGASWAGPFLYTWILQFGSFARFLRRQLRRVDDPELLRETAIDLGCMLALWGPLTWVLVERGLYLRVFVYAFALPAVVGLAIVYSAAKPLHTRSTP